MYKIFIAQGILAGTLAYQNGTIKKVAADMERQLNSSGTSEVISLAPFELGNEFTLIALGKLNTVPPQALSDQPQGE